jgi:hypothetical protein
VNRQVQANTAGTEEVYRLRQVVPSSDKWARSLTAPEVKVSTAAYRAAGASEQASAGKAQG